MSERPDPLESLAKQWLEALGEDPSRPGLRETPLFEESPAELDAKACICRTS